MIFATLFSLNSIIAFANPWCDKHKSKISELSKLVDPLNPKLLINSDKPSSSLFVNNQNLVDDIKYYRNNCELGGGAIAPSNSPLYNALNFYLDSKKDNSANPTQEKKVKETKVINQ